MLYLYGHLGIDAQVIANEREEVGEARLREVPAFFSIPLTFELHNDSLLVYVEMANIRSADKFILEQVNFLRMFGASTRRDDGYIFLPDGSGSIIENREPSRFMLTTSLPFYGADFGKLFSIVTDIPLDTTLPVFGIKRNNVSVFAIAEHGESHGGVAAEKYNDAVEYNMVYPWFIYFDSDSATRRGTTLTRQETLEPYNTKFVVRYNFLYDDDSTYSGWARFYQNYLVKTGVLDRREGVDRLPLDIELIGSINKDINILGIPIESEYAITTFKQAEKIMDLLKKEGISNVNLMYTGAMNGGLNFRSPNRISFQSELGGLRGFNNLYSDIRDMDYNMYNQVDFTRIYKNGHGLRAGMGSTDTSRHLNKQTAALSIYWPGDGNRMHQSFSAIVNPLVYDSVAENFIRNYEKVDSNNIYLTTIGSLLNSNFNENMEVTREESKLLTTELLQKLKDAGYNMKLDSGNAYTLKYADSLTNVPTNSSNRRLESYPIPFVGMVLKGYIPFTTEAINRSSNMGRTFLEAVESGAGLHYLLIYANYEQYLLSAI
jgi:hypothetical protein